jgi:hypothetical protein
MESFPSLSLNFLRGSLRSRATASTRAQEARTEYPAKCESAGMIRTLRAATATTARAKVSQDLALLRYPGAARDRIAKARPTKATGIPGPQRAKLISTSSTNPVKKYPR